MSSAAAIRNAVAAFAAAPTPLPLDGAVQHYLWGGYDFIPGLLGDANENRTPFAELWIGAHPGGPSVVHLDGARVSLDRLIAEAPNAILGPSVAARFGNTLPYLFKVLDARGMLSIQAHPDKHQAEEGFARENAAGIPLKAPYRNYRDNNHKPEVHVALTDFWMLHGFRTLEEIAYTLRTTPELAPLMPDFDRRLKRIGSDAAARRDLLRALYGTVMAMPQADVDNALQPLLTRLGKEAPIDKDTPDFWALRAAESYPLPEGHRDRGILSVYLLNLIHLKPGEGTFQPAGMLHAYLEGSNVELMANSDNVLRGGLTPKHVDVAELMQTLTFESGPSGVLRGEAVSETETVYRTPAAEFELSRLTLDGNRRYDSGTTHGPDAIITIEGAATAESGAETLPLKRGTIFLAPAGVPYTLRTAQPAVMYKASVPAEIAAS